MVSRKCFLGALSLLSPDDYWKDAKMPQFPFSGQLIQVVPKIPAVFCSMAMVLVVLIIQTLIALHRVSNHLIWPLEEQLVLDFLQNLMYWFSEYDVNLLRMG